MTIAQIDDVFPADPSAPRPAAERVPRMWSLRVFHSEWVAPKSVAIGATVTAIVNDSRWVAVCPTCGGAELVATSDPRFFCCNCRNAAVGGQWRTVVFPKNIAAIEAALLERTSPLTRQWSPSETVGDLKRETQAMTKILGL